MSRGGERRRAFEAIRAAGAKVCFAEPQFLFARSVDCDQKLNHFGELTGRPAATDAHVLGTRKSVQTHGEDEPESYR